MSGQTRRWLVVGLGLAAALGAWAGVRAMRPPAPTGPLYFPTTVGATAVYRTTLGDSRYDATERVARADPEGDGVRVTIERTEPGRRPETDVVQVSPGGLLGLREMGRDVRPPFPALRLPARAGDAWEWQAEPGPEGAPGRRVGFTVAGGEAVVVPAGTFTAVRVEWAVTDGGQASRVEAWYAPGVGLVKQVFSEGGKTTQVVELVSFPPGGA